MKISFVKKENPENKGGMKINYAPAKRNVSKAAWWLILAVVFAPFVWLLLSLVAKWFFVSSSGAVAMHVYPVKVLEAGVVTKVYVKLGESVSVGSPLLEIKRSIPEEAAAELKRVKAELEALEGYAAAPGLKPPVYMNGIVDHLANEERVMKELMENGAATRAEYNQAKERLLAAQNNREALWRSARCAA